MRSQRVQVMSARILAGVALAIVPWRVSAKTLEPIVYTVRAPQPATHVAQVEASVPTAGRDSVEMMMAVWSPGYYRLEHYESRVRAFAAYAMDGTALRVMQPAPNRWRILTAGRARVVIHYDLLCQERSVTLDWVDDTLAVLNGAPTFITLAEQAHRPHEVRLELAGLWKQSVTSLAPAPDGMPNHYRARDYEELVDSPIVAGALSLREFTVGGSRHVLASAGDMGAWDDARAARDLAVIVEAHRRFWGELPYPRYVFLNVFRSGAGGLEHRNSALLTSNVARISSPSGYLRWLQFVSHEYFHAMNVKRLRPVELGPFDYEHPPSTTSLWISEGLTSYFGELLVQRSGIGTTVDALARLSSHIAHVQNAPGRLVQTLEQSSLDVWSGGVSGIGRDSTTTVSYYEKGPVVGFLLDAHIRRVTGDAHALDDVMRLAYKRHSGDRGFTSAQFQLAAEDVARTSLTGFFKQALASTEELDYTEALEWFGLQFASGEARAGGRWSLEIRPDATPAQREHLHAWMPEPR
jgi:predicted metalloprotease with PDZ domain